MKNIDTNTLNGFGYQDGTPVFLVKMDNNGIFQDKPLPIMLDPDHHKGITWAHDEFHMHGSRCQRKSLFTPDMNKQEMTFSAVVTRDVSLYLYCNDEYLGQAKAYLKKNYQRLALARIADLKAIINKQEVDLGTLGL